MTSNNSQNETTMDNDNVRMIVKKIFIPFLFVLFIFGCVTVPKGPLKPDEVRLTNITIIETGNKGEEGKLYRAIIAYQHGEKTGLEDVKTVCISWSWLWKT